MVMKQDEQLNRYFEHSMTPSEEQNFLITVAASDEMRIAFRSQLELMKAVRSDKDALHAGMSGHPGMGGHPVAHVRYRTLAALGLSAAAATPFMDHELTRESSTQATEASMALVEPATVFEPATVMPRVSWLGNIMRTPKLALTAGLALGILSTTAVVRLTSNEGLPAPVAQSVTAPPTVVPVKTPKNFEPNETIPAPNGLNNSSHSEGVAVHQASASMPAVQSSTGLGQAATNTTVVPNPIPEVSKSNAGTMAAHTKIKHLNDSAAAK